MNFNIEFTISLEEEVEEVQDEQKALNELDEIEQLILEYDLEIEEDAE